MSFIGLTVKAVTFDERKVLDPYRKARRRWLFQKAGLIRTITRRSMKKRSGVSSDGQPPSVHEGGLKGGIRFDVGDESAVIGAVPSASRVAELLEKGGNASIRFFILGQQRDSRGRFRKGPSIVYSPHAPLRRGRYRPRPFMRPALETAAPSLPTGWRGAIRS